MALGRTCLVPSPHYSTRVSMRFGSRVVSEVRRFQRVRLGDTTSTFSIMHLIARRPPPQKKCIGIVFNCNTQEKWKTKVMQSLGGGGVK